MLDAEGDIEPLHLGPRIIESGLQPLLFANVPG